MLREWFVALYTHVVDHSRVVLTVPDGWGSDYINASYINVRPTVDISKLSAMLIICHIHVSVHVPLHRVNMEMCTLHHKVCTPL